MPLSVIKSPSGANAQQSARTIIYVVNAFELDAPTRLCLEVAKSAAKAGYRVAMLAWSRGGSLEPEIQRAGIEHLVLHGLMPRAVAELRARRPAIVHAILARPTVMGAIAARLAGIPLVVATHHGAHEWTEKSSLLGAVFPRVFATIASLVSRHVTVSQTAARELEAVGVSPQSITVIPNGVNAGYFYPARSIDAEQLRGQLFPDDNPNAMLLVGAMGNLREVKNHRQLVRAARTVLQQVPVARFVIWGDGPLRHELQQQIQHAGLTPVFQLPGATTDPRTALRACDVYVQTSRQESFGLSVAEAMACEVPVVVSDAGGLRELVENAGIICGSEDQQLVEALVTICSSRELREQLAHAGRDRISRNFSTTQMQARHLALYSELLQWAGSDV